MTNSKRMKESLEKYEFESRKIAEEFGRMKEKVVSNFLAGSKIYPVEGKKEEDKKLRLEIKK